MEPGAPTPIQAIQALVFAVLIGGSLAMWARISIRLASGQPLLPAEPRRPTPWNVGHVAAIAAIYLLLQAGGALIAHSVLPAAPVVMEEGAAQGAEKERPAKSVKVKDAAKAKNADDSKKADEARAGDGGVAEREEKKDADERVERLDPRRVAAAMVVHIVASLLSLLVAVPLLRWTAHCTWSDLGVVPGKILSDIKLGLAGFAAAAVPIYGLQFALSRFSTKRHPIIDWIEKSPDSQFLILAGISTILVAPLAEEFFFRLVLQGWFERLTSYLWPKVGGEQEVAEIEADQPAPYESNENPYVAPLESDQIAEASVASDLVPPGGLASWGPIVCSALIFALMHFDHGPAPIPLFFLALLLGYLYQQTHRILPSIVVHCCLNSCSMLILWTSLWK